MKYILETERLRLREFTYDDCDFIIELLNSPGWLQFIGDRNVRNREQAQHYLENGPFKSYRVNGYGLYMVEKKNGMEEKSALSIGMCGILNRDTLDCPDIGFALLPDFGGMGYALEIARATLVYAKEKLGLQKIAAITLPGNVRSIRLLEKLGLSFRNKIHSASGDELLLYSN
ncbi:GNAT family N-acetyltransferase [Fulvivirgaceae bacterium PWU4]|uniref:GNAT family N-acetyltransferase n=1 Tax=Chryseosolibacter histidini TaxID=2782349 RepID=A0AAP2DHR7_9BACT|nr:GNAT family N-acetyltransferase [Chryseosolibacter histidini]MBT1696633.1 GNAT family N-acetyltransferase [Chryseosolibacter histidini]